MDEPVWVAKAVVLALHEEQLAEHGGSPGLRDEGLLDSALDRPRNKLHYASGDVADLAAAYGYGLATNHPFIDGNKRVSLVTAETFLVLNGCELNVDDEALYTKWLAVAAGQVIEGDLASWLRGHIKPA